MSRWDVGLPAEARRHFYSLGVQSQALRSSLLSHPVYNKVDDVPALRIFMTNHAFAVWDFMTLLKSLQRSVTTMDDPWHPPKDRISARLINEINLEEETDEVEEGRYMSHYELYLEAMSEVGAERGPVETLVAAAASRQSIEPVLSTLPVPESTRNFTRTTLLLAKRPPHEVASAFLLGREAVIPAMFRRILGEVNERGDRWSRVLGVVRRRFRPAHQYGSLQLYLDRHIELDSGTHTPMGERLLMHLCGTDAEKWYEAGQAAKRAVEARRALWDGVVTEVERAKRGRRG